MHLERQTSAASLQHVENAAQMQAPVKTETQVLSPVNVKTKEQGSILSKKMEAKLDKLIGKNIEQMSSKEVGKHLKKCNQEAVKINKFIVKNEISDLSTSKSFSKFATHTGNAIAKANEGFTQGVNGKQSVFIKDVNKKAFDRSDVLQTTLGKLNGNLAINGATTQNQETLSDKELAGLTGVLALKSDNINNVETILKDNNTMSQLNSFIQEQDDPMNIGINEGTKQILLNLTNFAERMPNWQENLSNLKDKLENSNGKLTANEVWLLDNIQDVQAFFSKVDKTSIKDCPIISLLSSPLFSKENIENISNHRNQNFQVGDMLIFSEAKNQAYVGHGNEMNSKNKEILESGLWNGENVSDVGISFYTDGFSLNLPQLISSEVQQALKKEGITDIPAFLQEKYATAFTVAANAEPTKKSNLQKVLSIIPRIINKKVSIEEMIQSNQKKGSISEQALLTTFTAISAFKNELKTFCDEKGIVLENDILNIDMNAKVDLSKMFENMISVGTMSHVEPPTSLPKPLGDFNDLITKMMVAKKNMGSEDPRGEKLNNLIDQTITEMKAILTNLSGKGKLDQEKRWEERILILSSINNKNIEAPRLSSVQMELTNDIEIGSNAGKIGLALKELDAKQISALIEAFTLASILNPNQKKLVTPIGFQKTIERYIDSAKKNEILSLNANSNILQIYNNTGVSYQASYHRIEANAQIRNQAFLDDKNNLVSIADTAFKTLGLPKNMGAEIEQFIEKSSNEISLLSGDELKEKFSLKKDELSKIFTELNDQIAFKLLDASIEDKNRFETAFKEKFPPFNSNQFKTDSTAHGFDKIFGNLTSPAFLDGLFDSLKTKLAAEKELSETDPSNIGGLDFSDLSGQAVPTKPEPEKGFDI